MTNKKPPVDLGPNYGPTAQRVDRCPACRAAIYVRTCKSKVFHSPPFFRWACTECSWFDRYWHTTKGKAEKFGARA